MASFNKGDVSEGILAAAITARFISKTKRINEADVLSVVKKLGKPKGTKSLTVIKEFPSPNKNPNIMDTVICKVNLAEVNMLAFLNQTIYRQKDIKDIVNSAIAYANGTNIMKWADEVYNNNRKNVIQVNSEGLLDQTGTKVDLRVIIDGKQAGVGVSLKAGDVKQFGQVGGGSLESINEFFTPLGVNFSSAQSRKITEMFSDGKTTEALCYAYKEAHKQLTEITRSNQRKFRKDISGFIRYHATRNEPDTVLVQLNKGSATVYNFDDVLNRLKGVELEVQYSESSTTVVSGKKIPKITILVKSSKKPFLTLRNKLEGNRINSKGKKLPITVRNYVEKEKIATELLSETLK